MRSTARSSTVAGDNASVMNPCWTSTLNLWCWFRNLNKSVMSFGRRSLFGAGIFDLKVGD